jgi:hypothetical protein
MLRGIVIGFGAVCILGGSIALLAPGAAADAGGAGLGALILGLVLVLGTVLERVRYKPLAHGAPGPGWERTAERFVNEETGKTVTVYVRPETGERMYVEE